MVGQVRVPMRDRKPGIGVVKIHSCVDRIFKGTGGSVHCLKYSLKLQALHNHNYFSRLYTKISPVSYPFGYAHCALTMQVLLLYASPL